MNYSLSHMSLSPQMIHCRWKHVKDCVAFIQMTCHNIIALGMKYFQLGTQVTTFSWWECLSEKYRQQYSYWETAHWNACYKPDFKSQTRSGDPHNEVVWLLLCSCQSVSARWLRLLTSRFSSWSCTKITPWKFVSEFDDIKQFLLPVV